MAGKVFRIGHLGDLNELMLLGAIAGAEMAMLDIGIEGDPGSGVAAARRATCARIRPLEGLDRPPGRGRRYGRPRPARYTRTSKAPRRTPPRAARVLKGVLHDSTRSSSSIANRRRQGARAELPAQYTEYESTWTPDEIVERLKDADHRHHQQGADAGRHAEAAAEAQADRGGGDRHGRRRQGLLPRTQGITVVNIRNYAFNTVPEHVIALIFALRRNLLAYVDDVRRGALEQVDQFCFFDHPIRDIAGSTLGIVGYGALGKSIGKRAEALGMKVLPYDVFPQPGLVDFETILTESDIITLHVPLTPETKNMIGATRAREDEAHRHPDQHGARRAGRRGGAGRGAEERHHRRRGLRRADQGAAEGGQHPARPATCRT